MSRDLYAETEGLAGDLAASGHTTWSEELIGVLRGGAAEATRALGQ